MTVHPTRFDDSSITERFSDCLFSLVLGAVECRSRVGVTVQVRDVDETRNSGLSGDTGDSSSSRNLNVVEIKVPVRFDHRTRISFVERVIVKVVDYVLGLVIPSNQVVNCIRVSKTFLNLSIIVQIPFLRGAEDLSLMSWESESDRIRRTIGTI